MREKVEAILARIRPALAGTDVAFMGADEGTVKVRIITPLCSSGVPEDVAFEMVEDQLKEELPEISNVINIGE